MIPHERTRLTYAEQQTLLEMERHLDRARPEPGHERGWPWQLVGVVVVVSASMLLGGMLAAPPAGAGIAAGVGAFGILLGAALAIDPVRRSIRTLPQAIGVDRWRRQRLAQRLDGSGSTSGRRWRRPWRRTA